MYAKRERELPVKGSVVSTSVQNSNLLTGASGTAENSSVDFVNVTSVPVLDTPTITNIVLSALEGVQSGVPTRTTSTLTPTTLRSIAQFLEVPSVSPPESHSNQAGFVPPPVLSTTANTFVDNKSWGGGIATLTTVRDNTAPINFVEMPSVSPPITSTTSTTSEPAPRRAGGRRPNNIDSLSPEEETRLTDRRERNKAAAARCRKRRLDHTNRLQDETDDLEDKRSCLHKEIETLQRQREDLRFLLSSHEPSCKRNARGSPGGIKTEAFETSERVLEIKYEDSGKPVLTTNKYRPGESPALSDTTRSVCPQRPTSLAVVPLSKGVPDIGVAIETPSTALKSFGMTLDSFMDSGTGMTPVSGTGMTPLSSSMAMGLASSVASLNTPVITTTTCGSQQRNRFCEQSSPDSSPHKLVSL